MARLNMVVFMVVMVLGAMHIQSSDAQTTHTVGGSLGWVIPTQDPNAYSTWASSNSFKVGDILVFNFTTGSHTAAEVTKAAYDACTLTSPISTWTTGPASVTLNSSGSHYYLCTVPGHCSAGQKLAITVSAASAPAPTPSAAPPTPTPTPSPTPTPTPTPAPTPNPTPAPTPATTPSSSPAPAPSSPAPASAPTPSGTPATPPSGTPSAPAPGSNTTPSGPPGASDTPSSGSFLSAALPVTFLAIAMALYY
ncbi:uncharacterized protein LOC141708920 [Apium graveolens]|uniref:uncharacterized protein LOC141708920 n=1 Tax=Apium graveolens TaxID=4045 RepID=UPI003D7A216C